MIGQLGLRVREASDSEWRRAQSRPKQLFSPKLGAAPTAVADSSLSRRGRRARGRYSFVARRAIFKRKPNRGHDQSVLELSRD